VLPRAREGDTTILVRPIPQTAFSEVRIMLSRPLFAPFVIAFWCLTSGWLFVAKILPALQPGSPPGY